ncbi:MAG: site-specific integrase [Planctomycetes bacterium]|nr:site-specific integrase [Planctomycetota bacterium]
MPRKPGKVPSYCLHKHSGQAVVRVDGRDHYLGEFGSSESHRRYEELVAAWRAAKPGPKAESRLPRKGSHAGVTVNDLILSYWRYVQTYYVKHGRPTDEQAGIRSALRYVRRLYGHTPACEFRPLNLKAVRQAMIEADLSRGVVNQYVNRVRRMFKWGVENELVPVDVYQALMTVSGLRKDRSKARETLPVKPVPDKDFEATLPNLTEVVRAMVQFQRLTGCRPKDAFIIRPCDVDTSGEVWCYRPLTHKMEHEGRERIVYIGPRAQEVLRPWLGRAPDAYCFSPKEATAESIAGRRKNGGSSKPVRKSKSGKRAPGDCYTRYSYRQAVERACKRAGVPKWTPNQLRHSRGTEVRQRYGLEGSQVVLGHARADVTQVYAERNLELAARIARECG